MSGGGVSAGGVQSSTQNPYGVQPGGAYAPSTPQAGQVITGYQPAQQFYQPIYQSSYQNYASPQAWGNVSSYGQNTGYGGYGGYGRMGGYGMQTPFSYGGGNSSSYPMSFYPQQQMQQSPQMGTYYQPYFDTMQGSQTQGQWAGMPMYQSPMTPPRGYRPSSYGAPIYGNPASASSTTGSTTGSSSTGSTSSSTKTPVQDYDYSNPPSGASGGLTDLLGKK